MVDKSVQWCYGVLYRMSSPAKKPHIVSYGQGGRFRFLSRQADRYPMVRL